MCKKMVLAILITVLLASTYAIAQSLKTPSGNPEVVIPNVSKVQVVNALTNALVTGGYKLKPYDGGGNLLVFGKLNKNFAMALVAGSPAAPYPEERISFTLIDTPEGVRVVGACQIITNPGTAFEKATDMNKEAYVEPWQQVLTSLKKGFIEGHEKRMQNAVEIEKNFGADISGFRGIKWEDDLSLLKNSKPYREILEAGPNITFYTRAGDVPMFGGIKVEQIIYGFWKDKLLSIRIIAKGKDRYIELKTFLSQSLGAPTKVPGQGDSLMWSAGKGLVRLSLKEPSEESILTVAGQGILSRKYQEDKRAGAVP